MEKPKLAEQAYDYSIMWWDRLEYQSGLGYPTRKVQKL